MRWLIFIIFIMILTACGSSSYQNISVSEAEKLIEDGDVIVIDVRTPDEYNENHIPGSKLIPLQVIEDMSDELDKNSKYIIVCRSGNRSQQASDILAQKGFKNILNMSGGMNEWTGNIE